VLRYLSKDVEPLQQAECFNYLGQSDQVFQSSLFAPAQESSGSTHSPGSRRYLLDVNVIVAGGCLQVSLTYSKAIHRPATIESLAEAFMQELRSLIALSVPIKQEATRLVQNSSPL